MHKGLHVGNIIAGLRPYIFCIDMPPFVGEKNEYGNWGKAQE
jgi:hypothetical protein